MTNEKQHCCDCERYYAIMRAATDVASMKAQDAYTCTEEQTALVKAACLFLLRQIDPPTRTGVADMPVIR